MTEAERFMSFISPEPNSGCWLWDGSDDNNGYGMFRPAQSRRMEKAHRFSYGFHCGPIPDGKILDHLCRVRCCVNPSHLEPVTYAENSRRGLTGLNMASKTHCPHGHEYTPENTYRFRGKRNCIACRRRPR